MSRNNKYRKIIPINKNKRNSRRKQRKNKIIVISAIIIAVIIGVVLVVKPNAYRVTANDEVLGIVKGDKVPKQSLDTVVASLEDKYKTDVKVATDIDIKKVHASKSKLVTSDYLISQMKDNIEYNIKMIDLVIDGESQGIFPGKKEVNAVLDKVKDKYTPEDLKDNIEAKLLADVELKPVYVGEDSLVDSDKVYEQLTKTVEEGRVYNVASGDTFGGIANKHEMSIEELIALNPGIDEESLLQIGQEIDVKIDKPVVSVEITEEYKEEEEFIPDPIITEDADKYVTHKQQLSAAQKGKKEITINNIYVDGILEESINKDIEIVEEGQGEKIVIGTKKLPPKAATGKFRMPVTGRLTSNFGPRWGTVHKGIDLANTQGTPIYASDGGTVKKANWNGGYGNLVVIDHGNGLETYYGHASKLLVTPGQKVGKGEKIALMGSTGNSTGSHVHFEIRKSGTPVNPYNYI